MCELFGFNAENERDLREYLKVFYSHSTKHPHGWGLATYKNEKLNIVTEPVCASKSDDIAQIIDSLEPQNNLLGHIRLATVGTLDKVNCHPFTATDISGRQWILAHNGTVFSGMTLIKYTELQKGNTDSERILMYIIDRINERIREKGSPLNEAERCAVIDEVMGAITRRNKINIIIYDTELFYVHSNMKDTLYRNEEPGAVTFGTVPYSDTGWEALPLCTLLVYNDGTLIYTGKNHHNEYVESINLIGSEMQFNL